MPWDKEYDVAVIGSGPAGEGASMLAAKEGASVAMIERYQLVGGGCTHWGTIPSKALRHAVSELLKLRSSAVFGKMLENVAVPLPELLSSVSDVIGKQVKLRRDFYQRNGVPTIHGNASFLDPHTLAVDIGDTRRTLKAKKFIVATGSRPFRPADIDFTHPRIRDSDTVLDLDCTPHTITIYGAGVIGCEYASIFRQLGAKVNLINSRDKLLSFLDDEIIDALSYHLRDQGMLLRHNEEYERVETTADNVILHLKSGK
ncbi:MAG TPA: FAD-dependent oxidoreductase, partial [Polyangiales bacterium]